MPNPNEQANPLFHALTMMLQQQARPSSTYVDAPYVAQQQQQRQQNAFEQAKQEDYFNKVRALNELRAQGTNPGQMFQKANNFVGDFVTGNNTQQMMENVALNAVPIGKLLAAIAPLAKVGKRVIGEADNVFTTKTPHFWQTQLEYERGRNAPKNLYIAKVKNPSVGTTYYGHETVSPKNDVNFLFKIPVEDIPTDAPISTSMTDYYLDEISKKHNIPKELLEFHWSNKEDLIR